MKKETVTQFIRRLFHTFPEGERGDGCPDENILAAWLEDDGLTPAARRRLRRHLYRCPACLEKALLLRRLTGQAGPLFRRRGASLFQHYPALRPLASALAMVLVVGLLYLGGSSLVQISDQSQAPPPVLAPQTEVAPSGAGGAVVRQTGVADTRPIQPADEENDTTPTEMESAPPRRADTPAPSATATKSQTGPSTAKEEFAPVVESKDRQPPPEMAAESVPETPADKVKAAPPSPAEVHKKEPETAATRETRSRDISLAAQPLKPSALAGDETVGGVANEGKQAGPDSEWITNPHLILRDLCGRTDPVASPRLAAGDRVFFRIGDAYVEEGICADMQRRIRVLTGPDARSARAELRLPPQWRHIFLHAGEDILLIHNRQVTE